MQKKIAVFGGSFNPPGLHHWHMVFPLLKVFDEVIIVPCGDRPDKPTTGRIAPAHRAIMSHLAFDGVSDKVRVDDFDLWGGSFTRLTDLQARYESLGEIWHVVGTDLIKGGAHGTSDIQMKWKNGHMLWTMLNFAVFSRGSNAIANDDLPPSSKLFDSGSSGSSSEIRRRIAIGLPINDLVAPKIAEYITMNGLYRNG